MNALRLTVACWDYDRVRPLMDGRVRVDGARLNVLPLTPEETFFRAFRNAEFEVSELSLSSTLMMISRGECAYTPIPVFPSRSFRHSCIYVRQGSGIERPDQLRGCRVAIPEYQVTAAMVARGLLADEYAVQPSDLKWVQAGLEQVGREDKIRFEPPAGVCIEKVRDRTIVELFEQGEVDAMISPRAPRSFDPAGGGAIRRLFPEPGLVEAAYYRKTGIFPIMHVLGIRNDILTANPWLPGSLVKAFTLAKNMALAELADATALKVALPFLPAHVTEAHRLFGPDFWAYGLEANRKSLEAAVRWSHEQGLSVRRLGIEELFAPQSLASCKV
ncbi:MAG: ABC transporter substrate-binding protein [Burkholderiaceae bacterium]|nr:ABC transporter substrate-binding protein [Burkholderiaceae bacterium]MEB2350344.1 ABC transporter substrate-binding protein [Burkholderiaceae bacterium]